MKVTLAHLERTSALAGCGLVVALGVAFVWLLPSDAEPNPAIPPEIAFWSDPATGCEYFLYRDSITARLDFDGTPFGCN